MRRHAGIKCKHNPEIKCIYQDVLIELVFTTSIIFLKHSYFYFHSLFQITTLGISVIKKKFLK